MTRVNRVSGEGGAKSQDTADLGLILRELRDFCQDNKKHLEDIKDEIMKTDNRLAEAENRIEKAEERIQNTDDILAEMLKLLAQLEAKITDQESRSRRENIRIYGLPEGAESDSACMISFVEKTLRENLDIPSEEPLHVEWAHRSLGTQPPAGAQPRSILVKFLSYRTKETVLRLAWQKKGFTWEGKQINLDNDYAPRVFENRKAYAEVRKVLKERGIRFQTLYPAQLRVKYEDGFKTYEITEEATEDMSKRGLPVGVIKPPATLMQQLQQLTWHRVGGPREHALLNRRKANYKEKLQPFRRDRPPNNVVKS
ncbi:uncharacterized protein LOC119262033 [Pygocentrus nattereri]|uniref:uncharacterized protein LOC119262033 n=1 Tax=Pygocentrus nattereri TaxID=42514 RepID=UPI001891C95C|nr:uncharacterized protein LOC119262033 [Pygocentrus nattereri]